MGTLGADDSGRRAGHDPRAAALVCTTLSRVLADNRERRLTTVNYHCWGLSRYARTSAFRGGEVLPAPRPDVPAGPFPSGEIVLRRLGMTRADLAELWDSEVAARGVQAALSPELVANFYPPEIWPAVDALIDDGPLVAQLRLQRLMAAEARRPTKPTRNRPRAGTVSRVTIENLQSRMRRIMAVLCELNQHGYPSERLAAWVALPRRQRAPGRASNRDRSAPPRAELRIAWRALADDALARLEARSVEDLLHAIPRLAPSTLIERRAYWSLRNLALITGLAVVGPRAQAYCRLRRKDLVWDRPRQDGGVGPALLLRPAKALEDEMVRPKPIPGPVAAILAAPGACLDRQLGRGSPDDPLIPITASRRKHPPQVATFAGIVARVIDGHEGGDQRNSERRHGPHSLRRAASQLVLVGARSWTEATGDRARPETIAEVLLDHQLQEDPFGYNDINTEHGRERYAAIATEIAWRMLSTDDGARRAIDVDALKAAISRRTYIERELVDLRARIDYAQRRMLAEREPPRGARAAVKLMAELYENQIKVAALIERERRSRDELRDLDREIDDLKHNPARRIALPDDAPDDAAHTNSAEIDRELEVAAKPRTLREWIDVPELAAIAQVTISTVERWITGQLPFNDGDPRNPWPRGRAPIDDVLGPRRRRIWIAGTNPEFFEIEDRRERLVRALVRWPQGWSVRLIRRSIETEPPLQALHGFRAARTASSDTGAEAADASAGAS